MVPKVQGAEDIHFVDRLLAQLEAKAGLERPILVHAILETARGMVNIEEICGASPRMQGLSLGPADLAADRRMKTTRVGGGHPGYLVRQDPASGSEEDINADRAVFQQDLWHYTIARMVDACAMHGIYPYYGPFGDIADVVACEDQFRNAFLLGCVGAWSLHPKQIAIANKVFSPSPSDVAHARRVVEAMGDGTGAVMLDGKMEDDASLKQCLVMVELAEQLAAIDPELKKQYDEVSVVTTHDRDAFRPRRSVLYMPSSNERALEKAKSIPCDGLILDLEDAVAPDAKPAARDAACAAAASGEYGAREVTIRINGDRAPSGTRPTSSPRAQPDPTRSSYPRWTSADAGAAASCDGDGRPRRPGAHEALGDDRDAVRDAATSEEIAAASDRLTVLVMGTNDLVKELYAEHVPGRQPLLTGLGLCLLAARAAGKAILDGVYNDVKDTDGFLAECQQGREMGFDGKTLIHPGQVEGANSAFAPSVRGRRRRPRHPPGLGGRRRQRRRHLQRPDDREPPRRVRPAHPHPPRRDPGARLSR